ncbi:unnamed protein product [Heterosigma akashiwo]
MEGASVINIRSGRDLNVYIRQHENPQAPTVFFVHGACASMVQFAPLVDILKQRFSIVAYDLYGCGGSPKPESWHAYATEEHRQDLFALYQKFATDVNFMIGHSFGTSLVLSLASVGSKKHIHGMVLIGSTHIPGPVPVPLVFRLPLFLLNCLQAAEPPG